MNSSGQKYAFTIIELLVVIAIIALLMAILLPALAGARHASRTTICQSHLREMMTAYHSYASDLKDIIANINVPGTYGNAPDGDLAELARSFIVDRTGDTTLPKYQFPAFSMNLFKDHAFLALTAGGYLGDGFTFATICPEDRPRLTWRAYPSEMASSAFKPQKPVNKANLDWWPYSSTYELSPWACIRKTKEHPGNLNQSYVQLDNHDEFSLVPTAKVGTYFYRKMRDVAFPAQKAALYDTQQRHVGKTNLFFCFQKASQPIAFFDGSVSVRTTRDANKGQDPDNPSDKGTCRMQYVPDPVLDSPVPSGFSTTIPAGYYRWTRGGLGGIDFAGEEVPYEGY